MTNQEKFNLIYKRIGNGLYNDDYGLNIARRGKDKIIIYSDIPIESIYYEDYIKTELKNEIYDKNNINTLINRYKGLFDELKV